MSYFFRFLLAISACLLILVVYSLVFSNPSLAADKIVIKYGLFGLSVPIQDLRQYGETQKVSRSLQDLLLFLDSKEKQQVQRALQVKMSLDIVALDKLLYTDIGKEFLTTISPIITRRDEAGIQALRAAVILGAKSPEGLGIISLLEAYPSKRIVIDSTKALEIMEKSNLFLDFSELPPKDTLSSTTLWKLAVQYQILATQNKQYQGCLFGDSITSALGNTLGERYYNFAIDGLSTISLVEQLKLLIPANIKCQKVIIAIGGNDAWYQMSNEVFTQKLQESITLARQLGTQQIFLIPAFYSTYATSLDQTVAAPISRVDEINALINQIAAIEKVPVEASGIQPLYENNALKENLSSDGDHLNEEGLAIYRQALLKILR
ncbi:MAG: alpha/beta hydrolase [Potamolinea sp.]